jgi:hypothetical protein
MPATAPQLVPPPPPDDDAGAAARVRARIAVFEKALEDNVVTFHDVAGAWFELCDESIGAAERARLEELYPQLRAAFEKPRGGIISAYFCENVRVAAALTDIRKAAELDEGLPKAEDRDSRRRGFGPHAGACSSAIHLEPLLGVPDDPKAKELLYRCLELHYRALEFLKPKPRKICMRTLFSIVGAVLGRLDAAAAGHPADASEYDCLEGELQRAEAYYQRSAQRQARLTYLGGMACVALVAVLAAAGLAVGAPAALREELVAAALAGAAGGTVSVLTRMSRNQLALNPECGDLTLWVLGVSRVLLGALLGGAVVLLLRAGMLPTPAGARTGVEFFAAAAFMAGFTERLMGDAVGGDQSASSRGSSRMSSKTMVSEPAS